MSSLWRSYEISNMSEPSKHVVRLWDMFDGWMDITGPLSYEECKVIWLEKTAGGTKNTKYSDGDYYRIFPADTEMYFTPERLGR